jgi:hypothetical protein
LGNNYTSQFQGGLGIIDLIEQSCAFLLKLFVRSLLPGKNYGNIFCSFTIGRPWQRDLRWIFNKEINMVCSKAWENNFILEGVESPENKVV